MVRTVADQFTEVLAAALAAAGATRIYGIVGNSLDALTDSASRSTWWKPFRAAKAMRSPTAPERICGVRGKFS
jgi:hypothetical protein